VTDYCKDVGALIDSAHNHVEVAMYLMRYDEKNQCPEVLVRKPVEAKRRGADVVVYLQEDNYNKRAIEYLRENNIPVFIPRGFLHAKVVVADDCFVVGSHNWTWNAMHKNIEASVIVCNTPVIEAFFRGLESRVG
jgi:phosphatidylserine/phosphatidylglycerophosphate/cardiolipin synthase-like enzyme